LQLVRFARDADIDIIVLDEGLTFDDDRDLYEELTRMRSEMR
jgi:hypothetical protein